MLYVSFSNNTSNTETIFSINNGAANNPKANDTLTAMYHPPISAASNGRSLQANSRIIWRDQFD